MHPQDRFPKEMFVGTPLKTIAHPCDYCHGKGCGHCRAHVNPACGCHDRGICEVVVDDANDLVYIYGNVKHEDFHVPSDVVAYTAVPSAGFPNTGIRKADEIFEGEQDGNNITVAHKIMEGTETVYLNGLKQIEGAEFDYTREGQKLHFNFYDILPTDKIEVVYKYTEE